MRITIQLVIATNQPILIGTNKPIAIDSNEWSKPQLIATERPSLGYCNVELELTDEKLEFMLHTIDTVFNMLSHHACQGKYYFPWSRMKLGSVLR